MKKLVAAIIMALSTTSIAAAEPFDGAMAGVGLSWNDTQTTTEQTAFAGYRWNFNNVVVGGRLDAGVDNGTNSVAASAQLGYAFGNAMLYGTVDRTFDFNFNTTRTEYGVGADYEFDNGLLVGGTVTKNVGANTYNIGTNIGIAF